MNISNLQECKDKHQQVYYGPATVDKNLTVGTIVTVQNNETQQYFAAELKGTKSLCSQFSSYKIGHDGIYIRILKGGNTRMYAGKVHPLNFKMGAGISLLVQYSDAKSGRSFKHIDRKFRKKVCQSQIRETQVIFL